MQADGRPVIACPKRLYAQRYLILREIAEVSFGPGKLLIPPEKLASTPATDRVVVFGKEWGRELRLGSGRQLAFVDWVLSWVTPQGHLKEFVAVEVQSIDTTGNYRAERDAYLSGRSFRGHSQAGLNWSNVYKRILPQLIYKGIVLRREPLCRSGLYFVCPTPIYERIREQLGDDLQGIHKQPGSLTFRWYDVGPAPGAGRLRPLVPGGEFTTTVEEVGRAVFAPGRLPPAGIYQEAVERELEAVRGYRA
jgi:hypothetical protein